MPVSMPVPMDLRTQSMHVCSVQSPPPGVLPKIGRHALQASGAITLLVGLRAGKCCKRPHTPGSLADMGRTTLRQESFAAGRASPQRSSSTTSL